MFVHVGSERSKVFRSTMDVWFDGVVGGLFTFILSWTLLYGMVHIY